VPSESRSLGCARCGDCCERIWLSVLLERLREWLEEDSDHGRNARFILEHWHVQGSDEDGDAFYTCDAFDAVHRLCTAHETRPPVCSGYPWYGKGPRPDVITRKDSRCSYLLDVPPAVRPSDARPLIPIEVVTR
jgi:Fe-S-cluster containining protein